MLNTMRRTVFGELLKFDWRLVVSFLVVSLLPSFMFVVFRLSSLWAGLLISLSIVMIFNIKSLMALSFKPINAVVFFSGFFSLFIVSVYLYLVWDVTKPIFSMVIVFLVLTAMVLAKSIEHMRYEKLSSSFLVFVLFLIALGWFKLLFTISCCNYDLYSKEVFPFSEESHYALSLGMFSVAYSVAGNRLWVLFIGLNLFLLTIIFPSLTLLLFTSLVFLAASFRLRPVLFKGFIVVAPMLIFLLLIYLVSNLEYFSSRLTFEDTRNVTTLVFLQGWHLAYINLIETNGLGLGFQMLGSVSTHLSPYAEKIYSIMGEDRNIPDGGFLAAKFIAEFGVIGVLCVIGYVVFLIKFVFYANQVWAYLRLHGSVGQRDLLMKRLLISGVVFAFLVEFLFRGLGYFSPGVFFMVFALAMMPTINKQLKLSSNRILLS